MTYLQVWTVIGKFLLMVAIGATGLGLLGRTLYWCEKYLNTRVNFILGLIILLFIMSGLMYFLTNVIGVHHA